MNKFKDFKVGDIEISEPIEEGNVSLSFGLPVRESYAGKRTLDEYEKLLLETCRVSLSIILRMSNYFAFALAHGDVNENDASDFIRFLSEIGGSYNEFSEEILMSFERLREENAKQSEVK